MSKKKKRDSISVQLISLCQGNATATSRANLVKEEFERVELVDSMIKNEEQKRLNKVLHSTRAMDTGMRAILDRYAVIPGQKSMGGYLAEFRKGKSGCFARLSGSLSQRIQDDVVEKRNIFMHAAGQYPTPAQMTQMLSDVNSYLQTIINLVE